MSRSSIVRSFTQGPLTRFAMRHGHRIVRALGGTWTLRYVGRERVDRARWRRGPVLYAFTHGVLLPLAYAHRDRGVQVLISESRDGEIISRITDGLGFTSVRGSSTRGGERAVVEMARLAKAGYDLAISPDGPKGPRGSVAPGVRIVSSRADVPVVPVGVGTRSGYHARSWDRFLVPKPFAEVWIVYGDPVNPRETGRSDTFDQALEAALHEVEARAQRLAAGREHAPSVSRLPA